MKTNHCTCLCGCHKEAITQWKKCEYCFNEMCLGGGDFVDICHHPKNDTHATRLLKFPDGHYEMLGNWDGSIRVRVKNLQEWQEICGDIGNNSLKNGA